MRSVGTDLVSVERLEQSLCRGTDFIDHVFSALERAYCDAQTRAPQHYAARFAAKEAFLKAVGRGVLDGIRLADIEVVNSESGAPKLRLGPTAATALAAVGGTEALVSLSHDAGMALAVVVIP